MGPYNCKFDKAEKVGSVVGVFTRQFGVFDKSWFERIPMEFEGHEVYVPSGYDQILRIIYGDYMQLPPESKRVTHHICEYIWV